MPEIDARPTAGSHLAEPRDHTDRDTSIVLGGVSLKAFVAAMYTSRES